MEFPRDVVPSDLTDLAHWVVWTYEERDGKPTKVPYRALLGKPVRGRASSTDPSTWSSFETALTYHEVESWTQGMGFMLSVDDPFVGVDLDHCVHDQIDPWAKAIVRRLNSYTEITPSGEGLRVFVRGTLPPGGRKKKNFEVYDRERFLTVTGNRVSKDSVIEERTAELGRIHAEIFGEPANGVVHATTVPKRPLDIADAELLAKARQAVNGAAFWALWNGDSSGYGSPSEADLALASHLAWWTSGSPSKTDQLFRQSHLFRPKWDERHGDRTYGQRTIDKALSTMTSFYEPGFTSSTPRIRLIARPGESQPENEPLPLTDLGNGQRLVARYGHALRYCHPWSKWLAWDGARWRVDDTGAVWRCAKATARAIFQEAADVESVDLAKALGKHALRTQADSKLAAMIHQAESEPAIPVLPDDLDADPWLSCIANGVLDLRTGELGEHDRDLMITKVAPIVYDPNAECPTWERFLERILDGKPHLIEFVQRAIGYSLTGSTRERVIFFLHGTGSNGKSTLIETVRLLLGDYAQRTPTDTLLAKRENAIPNDVARLRGARFVSAVETEEGKRLAEAMVKDLTGGDTIAARFMRGEWFDFKPSFKIWLATNHKPVIRGTDNAIWNRIRLIPFTVTIPENEQDPQLGAKLQAELPGILAWAVRGCLAWQRQGLGLPAEVRAATDSYRADMDVLAGFLQDNCILDPQATVTAKAIYDAYKRWCDDTGERPITQRRFGENLAERGFARAHTKQGWSWTGARLRLAEEPPQVSAVPNTDISVTLSQSRVTLGDPKIGIALRENDVLETIPELGSPRVTGHRYIEKSEDLPW